VSWPATPSWPTKPGAAAAAVAADWEPDPATFTWVDTGSILDGAVSTAAGVTTFPVAGDAGTEASASGLDGAHGYAPLLDANGDAVVVDLDKSLVITITGKIDNPATLYRSGAQLLFGVAGTGYALASAAFVAAGPRWGDTGSASPDALGDVGGDAGMDRLSPVKDTDWFEVVIHLSKKWSSTGWVGNHIHYRALRKPASNLEEHGRDNKYDCSGEMGGDGDPIMLLAALGTVVASTDVDIQVSNLKVTVAEADSA